MTDRDYPDEPYPAPTMRIRIVDEILHMEKDTKHLAIGVTVKGRPAVMMRAAVLEYKDEYGNWIEVPIT